MNRERSPSEDRGRGPRPVWDNPNSQLPGTGVQAGFESGLYGTSRRRDHSVPERTRLRTSQSEGVSTGSTAGFQVLEAELSTQESNVGSHCCG